MLPLRDDLAIRGVPAVTVGLIAANVLVFLYQASLQASPDPVPCRLTGACRAPADFPQPAVTVLTAMFLHGTLFHVGGNMLYLWIFGHGVEDTLGHLRFVAFYVMAGAAAALVQTAVHPASPVPMIGASGAVSGVLGAYLVLFPYARVLTLMGFGVVHVPAVIVLGLWIVVQLVNGLIAAGQAAAVGADGAAGVAWFAHVGGFLAGMSLLFVLRPRPRRRL
jgi:membrane associated rhomboid family serine protease